METLDSIKAMLVFEKVVHYGSFAEAARRMGLTRAVVSYHVKRLETQLDVQLLHRNTRNISLTPAGALFYERCRLIASEAVAAKDELLSLSSNPVGTIRLTCSVNWGLKRIVPAVIAFRKQYPKIEVNLMLTDEVVNLVEEGIDLAFRGAPLQDSNLISRKIVSEPTVVVAANSMFDQSGTATTLPKTIEELAQLDWVIYTPSAATLVLEKDGLEQRIKINGPVKTNNSAARLAFTLAGQGVSKLPLWTVKSYLDNGEMIELLPDYNTKDIDIYGVYPRRLGSANPVTLLIDFIKDRLTSLDAE
ncbi:LysR family transcriptional regulator [Flocculibacter collagenilyticus]|uniref:LysR family transcriptional regulator n=1 Tax=Flocculibacter collagenilyticus TaxID=2744479 RepID=UPI0018F5F999|nr:LysR family transcriptional regulator [Flocculibacter collagenilyticus]